MQNKKYMHLYKVYVKKKKKKKTTPPFNYFIEADRISQLMLEVFFFYIYIFLC